jgi:hypothetical protein
VTGGGAWDVDMPIFPWSAPGDVPPIGDAAFDALLAGELPPEAAAPGLHPVAEMIAALNGTPLTSELASGATALAVFRGEVGRSREPVRPRRRRHPVLATLLSAKLAAAAGAAAVTFAGATAAAYAGVLPAPVQKFAHDTIGTPPAHPAAHPSHSATRTGPRAGGQAAYGLCTAYSHAQARGSAMQKAVAFRNLAAAAGGAVNVTAYCARVAHPGTTPAGHPAGKPASHPGGKSASHPAGKPASHPGGKSASHPAGKPASTP